METEGYEKEERTKKRKTLAPFLPKHVQVAATHRGLRFLLQET